MLANRSPIFAARYAAAVPDQPRRGPRGEAATWPLGRLLSTAARMVEYEWNEWLAQHDLTHAGLLALHALQDGPLTQRELAADSHVEEQTMSRVLRRLERSGHVTRRRDPADRRRLVVERTPSGTVVAEQVLRVNVAERLVSDRLNDAETFRAELIRLIEDIQADPDRSPQQDAQSPAPDVVG